jgi:hypothetical protein
MSMGRRILVLALATSLTTTCFGLSSPQEQVRALATNTPVEVKFVDGSRQRGRISGVSDTGFVLKGQTIPYSQVQTVKELKNHKKRNILIAVGVVVTVGLVVAIIWAASTAAVLGGHN